MADRPIVFSAPMVLALLAGAKIQTRRILKPQPNDLREGQIPGALRIGTGDRLWVREALGRRTASFLGIEATNGVENAFYKADGADVLHHSGFNLCPEWKGPTCSPRYMPRAMSRLTLKVTDVRVQRLQDISEEDAQAEGWPHANADPTRIPSGAKTPVGWFRMLWCDLHGAEAWDASPWVAALTFTTTPANIDSPREAS